MLIRDAGHDDMPAVTAIYNHAVANTTAIFNYAEVDVANRLAWLADRRKLGYPVLVAVEDDGQVAGYASFGDWRAFDGYKYTVEHSIYVHIDQRGKGIGETLLRALIERAKAMGKHIMIAGIEAGNTGSIRLHEKIGFDTVGHMAEGGTKFGRWLDLVFMQLILDPGTTPDGR